MILSAWVLFCRLAIANLQRIAVLKESQVIKTPKCKEYLIIDNFIRTTVVRGPSPQNEFCITEDPDEVNESIDMVKVIDLYKTFNFTNSYDHITPNSPIKESGLLSVNDHQELPLFLSADIKFHNIRMNPDGALGRDTDEQMNLMGLQSTDERVCLLPHSLGGARGSNVVPMARNVYRRPSNESESTNLDPPLSSWKTYEDWILRFLQTYQSGLVKWTVAVQYLEGVVADPGRNRAYRPVGFSLLFSAYENRDNLTSLFYSSNQTTLLNRNNEPCGKHSRNDTPSMPAECRLPAYTLEPLETIKEIGVVTSSNAWRTTHVASLPYRIENRTFFYGQSVMENREWFIQELLPDGQMGEKISMGTRDFYYKVLFSYTINGRHFLYCNRGSGGTYWFIQELLPDGQMGLKMSDGNWASAFHACFPYIIRGKHYFYCQVESTNQWYIHELFANGLIGRRTGHGYDISPVIFIYEIKYNRFLYSHDPIVLNWHTQELFANGTMGPITNQGKWKQGHHISIPYYSYGRSFFFGKNLYTGYWFIQMILGNGAMGVRVAEGKSEERYGLMFAYSLNESYYVYGHDQATKKWMIKKVLLDPRAINF